MTVINMQALKDRAKRLTVTGRLVRDEPQMQTIRPPMTAEQREQADAIKYFFKTRSRDHE
jgi:hypothetical protein